MKLVKTTLDKYLAAKDNNALGEEDIYFVHDKGIYVGEQKIFSEGATDSLTLREGILTPAGPTEKLLCVLDDDGQPLDREDIVSYNVYFRLYCSGGMSSFKFKGSYTETMDNGWSNDVTLLAADHELEPWNNRMIFAYPNYLLSKGRVRIYGVYLYAMSMDGEITSLGYFDNAQDSPDGLPSREDNSFWWTEGTVLAQCRK